MGNSGKKQLKQTEIIKNRCMQGQLKLSIIDGKEAFATPLLEGLHVNVLLYRSKLRISFESGEVKELDMTSQVTILKYNRDTFTFVLAVNLSEIFQIWNFSFKFR